MGILAPCAWKINMIRLSDHVSIWSYDCVMIYSYDDHHQAPDHMRALGQRWGVYKPPQISRWRRRTWICTMMMMLMRDCQNEYKRMVFYQVMPMIILKLRKLGQVDSDKEIYLIRMWGWKWQWKRYVRAKHLIHKWGWEFLQGDSWGSIHRFEEGMWEGLIQDQIITIITIIIIINMTIQTV